jgi:hypothetical protein
MYLRSGHSSAMLLQEFMVSGYFISTLIPYYWVDRAFDDRTPLRKFIKYPQISLGYAI